MAPGFMFRELFFPYLSLLQQKGMTKICSKCHLPKTLDNYTYAGRKKDNWQRKECNACRNIISKCSRYQITRAQYDQLFAIPKCATYGDTKHLVIDHNHLTGKIRGILCNTCNLTIGRVKEEIRILENMITYLEKEGSSND